jgi:hypothetical protein
MAIIFEYISKRFRQNTGSRQQQLLILVIFAYIRGKCFKMFGSVINFP